MQYLKFLLPAAIVWAAFAYGQALPLGGAAGGKLYGLIALVLAALFIVLLNLPALYVGVADRAYKKGDKKKAFNYFERAYKTGRLGALYVVYYSYVALREGRMETSDTLVGELLKRKNLSEKDRLQAKTNLGLLRWKQGQLDEAAEILAEVHEKGASSVSYGNLGLMYILQGDLDKALAFALEAYDYNDGDNAIADNLGEVYFLRGEYGKADEIYQALMERSPKTPTPYYNYGKVLAAKGDAAGAEDYFTRALRFKFNSLTCVSREDVEKELAKLK